MKVWLVGLVGGAAFFLICWIAITSGADALQTRIADEAVAALSDPSFDAVEITVEGRTVMLLGEVATGVSRAQAEQSVRSLPGVRRVINRLQLGESESARRRSTAPYQLIVSFSDETAVFSGLVASEQSRSSLKEIAKERSGAVDLVDSLRLETNVRDEWQDAPAEILSALVTLPKVHVELTDAEVFVTGQALTSADRESVAQKVRAALPYGVTFRYDVKVRGE